MPHIDRRRRQVRCASRAYTHNYKIVKYNAVVPQQMRNKHSLLAHANERTRTSHTAAAAAAASASASASTRTSDQTKQRTPAYPSLPDHQSPQSPPSLPGHCCCYLHPQRRRRRKSDTEWGYGENM